MAEGIQGVELRDFFAALALAGMMAKPDIHQPVSVTTRAESSATLPQTDAVLAERAYRLANAMLTARERVPVGEHGRS
jgi:hypothetical protein